jgi:hypothetical protein
MADLPEHLTSEMTLTLNRCSIPAARQLGSDNARGAGTH